MDSANDDRQLMRALSFELEHRVTPETAPFELNRMVVEERRENDAQRSLSAPWRRLFEPWVSDPG
jgi:hypothetical protein